MEANMKICKLLLPVTLALFLMGCGDIDNPLVLSLQPLFTPEDLNFDPGLVGTFGDRENDTTFMFKKSTIGTGYDLIVAEKDGEQKTSEAFDAHLVRLGGFWFLDFYPANLPAGVEFYSFHLMRGHSIGRIWIEGDVVRIALLDSDWVKKGIDEKRLDIKHEIFDDDTILLTDTTLAFQDLASRHGNDEEAFTDTLELRRLPDSPEKPNATPEKGN
jgi:hypothetical protein